MVSSPIVTAIRWSVPIEGRVGKIVATENHIRAGPAAEMGYSHRRDDRPLEAARRIARRSVQIACGSGSRDRISRQRLVVLQRSAPARLRLRTADRLIFVWLYRLFPSLLEAAVVFKPETLVRWHRSGFRLYWRCKSRRCSTLRIFRAEAANQWRVAVSAA